MSHHLRSHHRHRSHSHHRMASRSPSRAFDLDRPTSSAFGVGATSSLHYGTRRDYAAAQPSPTSQAAAAAAAATAAGRGLAPLEADPKLLATLTAQGARVFVDLAQVARSFRPEAALSLTPSQLYDHLVASGVPAEDARVLRAQEVDGKNFTIINDQQLERWGIAPWGRRVALVQALQALAFEGGLGADGRPRPRPSDLLDEQSFVGFDAHRERNHLAALSLHNGGLDNGYGLGAANYRLTERERMQRERDLRHLRQRDRHVDDFDLDPRDGRVHTHSYEASPVDEYRARGGHGYQQPRGLDRYSTLDRGNIDPIYDEYARGPYSPAYGRSLDALGAGMGALSIREREMEAEAREREREAAHQARESARRRARSAERRAGARPASAGVFKYGYAGGEELAHTSPSYTLGGSRHFFPGGTLPLRSPLAGRASAGYGGGSTSFEQAERDRALERAALERRERELLEAGRFGASLGASMLPGGAGGRGYDSDDDRVYHHPRRHGYASYYKQHFGAYAEPLQSSLGGGGHTQSSNWLEEFYRPVDVRGSRSQWLSQLQPPSYSLRNNPSLPEARLKLEWIYGYKSYDSRSNLVYNNVGDIVYPVASTVVVYKQRHRLQRHMQCHNDEVRCIAQHPINLNLIASGQTAAFHRDETGRAPHIAVWDSTDFNRIWILKLTAADKAIRCMAFSADGKYLVSISNDAHHTLKLWDWETRTLLGSSRGDSYALFAVKWNHKDPAEFVTVGKQHAVFWRWDGAKLTARKAHLPGGRNVSFYSVAFSEKGYACLGADDGGIYVFVDGRLVREFKRVHRGKVFTLDWFPGGLISGGGDGVVHVLDKKLDVVRSFTFHHRVTSVYARGNHLLVGTQGSQIFEIVDFMHTNIEGDNQAGIGAGQPLLPIQGGSGEWQSPTGRIGIEPIVQGHYDGELHGVAITPGGREVVSVGEDNQLCVWEITTHRLLRRAHISDAPGKPLQRKQRPAATSSSHPLHQCARSVAVSPNGKFIAVGCNNGELAVFTAGELRRVHSHDLNQYSKRAAHAPTGSRHQHPHWIQCMKYSPNGHTLAVGTHGAVIVLLDTRDEYRVKGVLSAHESFITALDFSDDGAFLASTDGLYQLKFHQLFENDLAQSTLVLDARSIRDVKWSGQNCVLGFAVQGILETGEAEGYLINAIEVSPSRAFVVSGDDAGQVQLFRFPVLEKGHQSHAYHAHASHVVAVRWSLDEKYVISAGGHDNAMCQWKLS